MRVLSSHCFVCSVVIALLLAGCTDQAGKANKIVTSATEDKPRLTEGITELNLRGFYKFPVGPRGLEPTKELLRLIDKRVRGTGYMVKEEEPTAGLFMLAPIPWIWQKRKTVLRMTFPLLPCSCMPSSRQI